MFAAIHLCLKTKWPWILYIYVELYSQCKYIRTYFECISAFFEHMFYIYWCNQILYLNFLWPCLFFMKIYKILNRLHETWKNEGLSIILRSDTKKCIKIERIQCVSSRHAKNSAGRPYLASRASKQNQITFYQIKFSFENVSSKICCAF